MGQPLAQAWGSTGRARGPALCRGVGGGWAPATALLPCLSFPGVSSKGKQTCLLGTLAMNSACSDAFLCHDACALR